MIIRGLAGVIIGLAYGSLVSGVVFLLTRIDLNKPRSGMIMLDPVVAWIAIILSGLIAGVCGALVGLIVGMARLDKAKAATVGFFTGLLVFALLSLSTGPSPPGSLRQWIELFVAIAILPIGVALTGMIVAIVTRRL